MALTDHLSALVEEASADLPNTKKQRMFGCDGFFANDNIYGIIWKTGRIGLKFRDPAHFDAVMAMKGTERWSPSGSSMSQWLLLPESFHDDVSELVPWVEKAHRGAFNAPPKDKKPKKTTAKGKTKPAGAKSKTKKTPSRSKRR